MAFTRVMTLVVNNVDDHKFGENLKWQGGHGAPALFLDGAGALLYLSHMLLCRARVHHNFVQKRILHGFKLDVQQMSFAQ